EGRPPLRYVELEYHFDRLVAEKLVQAYRFLVPERSMPIATAPCEVKDETSSHICAGVVGTAKRAGDDRQSDCGIVGTRQESELGGPQRVAICRRRLQRRKPGAAWTRSLARSGGRRAD